MGSLDEEIKNEICLKDDQENLNKNNLVMKNNPKINYTDNNPKLHFQSGNINKLREVLKITNQVFMINNLKKQISNYRQIVKEKNEELSDLKVSSKVSKYKNLECEYKQRNEELFLLKNNYKKINQAYSEYLKFNVLEKIGN